MLFFLESAWDELLHGAFLAVYFPTVCLFRHLSQAPSICRRRVTVAGASARRLFVGISKSE